MSTLDMWTLSTKLSNVCTLISTGENCMSGRNIMMGYLNRPDKTNEDIDADGWLHSGDLGTYDSEGFLYITGMC